MEDELFLVFPAAWEDLLILLSVSMASLDAIRFEELPAGAFLALSASESLLILCSPEEGRLAPSGEADLLSLAPSGFTPLLSLVLSGFTTLLSLEASGLTILRSLALSESDNLLSLTASDASLFILCSICVCVYTYVFCIVHACFSFFK